MITGITLGLLYGFIIIYLIKKIRKLKSFLKDSDEFSNNLIDEITRLKEEHLNDIKTALTCSDNDRNRWFLRIKVGEQVIENLTQIKNK